MNYNLSGLIKTLNEGIQILKWFINKPKKVDSQPHRLHLGCGEINVPGFINIDKRPFPHVHYLSGVDKLPFIKNNSVDLIYISHCLEHIPRWSVENVLNEYFKKLKAGGILRISVPNFKTILEIYQDTENLNNIQSPLFGSQEYKYNFHYIAYDYTFLENLLKKSNFTIVRPWIYGDGELKSIPDWSGKKIKINNIEYNISLNIEAIK